MLNLIDVMFFLLHQNEWYQILHIAYAIIFQSTLCGLFLNLSLSSFSLVDILLYYIIFQQHESVFLPHLLLYMGHGVFVCVSAFGPDLGCSLKWWFTWCQIEQTLNRAGWKDTDADPDLLYLVYHASKTWLLRSCLYTCERVTLSFFSWVPSSVYHGLSITTSVVASTLNLNTIVYTVYYFSHIVFLTLTLHTRHLIILSQHVLNSFPVNSEV